MKLELFTIKKETLWSTVSAELSDGRLTVSGQDLGRAAEIFGGEYEYAVSLDAENTRKLFEALGCEDAAEEKKLLVLKDTFPGNRAVSALKKYCDENKITAAFWSRP